MLVRWDSLVVGKLSHYGELRSECVCKWLHYILFAVGPRWLLSIRGTKVRFNSYFKLENVIFDCFLLFTKLI